MDINIDKLYHGILGLAIGDALGVPAEFMSRKQLEKHPITDIVGGGYWDQLPGTWSDDTAMTLATVDALNKSNWEVSELTYHLIMTNFLLWLKAGKFASFEHRFDVGNTCREAILRYSVYGNTKTCGLGEGKCGNGALMRILPAAFINDDVLLKISRLTHNNIECDSASIIYAHLVRELMTGKEKNKAFQGLYASVANEFINVKTSRLFDSDFKYTESNNISSSGYVIDTLEAAIWCFLNTDNYRDCVLKAVNLGDDTDTVAAVAGSLAGVYYGINEENGIPKKWINNIRDFDTLQKICFNK